MRTYKIISEVDATSFTGDPAGGVSMTKPDKTLSMREIVNQFTMMEQELQGFNEDGEDESFDYARALPVDPLTAYDEAVSEFESEKQALQAHATELLEKDHKLKKEEDKLFKRLNDLYNKHGEIEAEKLDSVQEIKRRISEIHEQAAEENYFMP